MKNFLESPEEIGEITKEEVSDVYEDDEEEKMETFFALVRGYQEARNRRRNELKEIETTNNKKMRSCGEDRHNSGWIPAFQWEDFTHESENRKHPQPLVVVHAGGHASIDNKKEDKKMEEEDHKIEGELDLTLAL